MLSSPLQGMHILVKGKAQERPGKQDVLREAFASMQHNFKLLDNAVEQRNHSEANKAYKEVIKAIKTIQLRKSMFEHPDAIMRLLELLTVAADPSYFKVIKQQNQTQKIFDALNHLSTLYTIKAVKTDGATEQKSQIIQSQDAANALSALLEKIKKQKLLTAQAVRKQKSKNQLPSGVHSATIAAQDVGSLVDAAAQRAPIKIAVFNSSDLTPQELPGEYTLDVNKAVLDAFGYVSDESDDSELESDSESGEDTTLPPYPQEKPHSQDMNQELPQHHTVDKQAPVQPDKTDFLPNQEPKKPVFTMLQALRSGFGYVAHVVAWPIVQIVHALGNFISNLLP